MYSVLWTTLSTGTVSMVVSGMTWGMYCLRYSMA